MVLYLCWAAEIKIPILGKAMQVSADTTINDKNLQVAYESLAAERRDDGLGIIYAFTSPHTGAGTSYVVRGMAKIAAKNASANQQVLIVDMDIQNNAQSAHFFAPDSQSIRGMLQGPYDATFGTTPFWRVTPSMVNEHGQNMSDSHFMSLYICEDGHLAFTHFHWERFRQGQNAHIQNSRAYWHALRSKFYAVFVDTPALDRGDIASSVCGEADMSILVSSAAAAKSQALLDAANYLDQHEGVCAGVIINDAQIVHSSYGGKA